MAIKQINVSDLRDNEEVTLRLRDGESVIVGTVEPGFTTGGGRRVSLKNNANSVVIYETTNFRVFVDRGPTVGEVLEGVVVGDVFRYRNKYGVTKEWVVTGYDRVTLVDSDRPAHSLSISGGFPVDEEAGDRLEFVSFACSG